MKQGFVITHLACEGCKQQMTLQPSPFVPNEDAIERIAVELHGKTKIICGNPKLIAIYCMALVADELIPDEPIAVIPAASNGGR